MRFALALLLLAPAASAGDAWVLIRGENSVTMSGNMDDLAVARRYLKRLGPGYLWFRHDGKAYVVQDNKALQTIDDATRPQEELGAEQARLGQKQAELGQKQAELGAQQARAASDTKAQDELSHAQDTLAHEQDKIAHEQDAMARQQDKLSKELERKIAQLLDTSIKDGTARPID